MFLDFIYVRVSRGVPPLTMQDLNFYACFPHATINHTSFLRWTLHL